MDYFKKILRFAKPYSKYGYLNIFFNILYALFSALSFAALIPMLDVLFTPEKKVLNKPIFTDMSHIKDYLQDYINFRVTDYSAGDAMKGLVLVIGLVLVLFLLKNLFNYLAMYFMVPVRSGIVRDLRNTLYNSFLNFSFDDQKDSRLNMATKGHIKAHGGKSKRIIKEFRLEEGEELPEADHPGMALFEEVITDARRKAGVNSDAELTADDVLELLEQQSVRTHNLAALG